MIITKEILDELTEKAKASPRLRCNLDLRNSADDQSQRMLNALEPGTVLPIHRHKVSSETCVCIRGHFEEYFYDTEGRLTGWQRDRFCFNLQIKEKKNRTNVDKAYTASTFFIFGSQNSLFERQKDTMLKITPSFQMLQIDGSIFLTDINKLEKPLGLDAILVRETARDVTTISSNLAMNTTHLLKVCKKPKLCKKLRHALQESKVVKKLENGSLTVAQIINFVETKTKLKFKYNRSKTKFQLGTDAEAERFIKLMDDDYLMSELTGEKYDSPNKDAMES